MQCVNSSRSAVYFLFVLVLFAGFLQACKKPPVNSIDGEDRLVKRSGPQFTYLDSKFRLNYQSDLQSFRAKVRLRMRRDSLIWASVTAFGLEGARIKITPDSIFIIDRRNKQYIAKGLDTLNTILNFPFDFEILQSIVLGEMPFPLQKSDTVKEAGRFQTVVQERNNLKVESYLYARNQKLKQITLDDTLRPNNMVMEYEGYSRAKGYFIPSRSKIEINFKGDKDIETRQTVISIIQSKAEVGEEKLTFPFFVPSKYEKL